MFRIKAPLRIVCALFLYVFVYNTFILFTFVTQPLSVRAKSSAKMLTKSTLKCISYFEFAQLKLIVLGVDLLIIV